MSERSDFAAACEANGITFIGPRAQVMAKMGDKVSARQSALDAGLPIIPGTDSALSDPEVIVFQWILQKTGGSWIIPFEYFYHYHI